MIRLTKEADDWIYRNSYDSEKATFEVNYSKVSVPVENIKF